MRLFELYEGLSSVVYHVTSIDSMMKIASSDSFVLQPLFASAESHLGDDGFFMSTSRSRSGGFMQGQKGSFVSIQLDGTKLSKKVNAKPIDYFKTIGRGEGSIYQELEDRIISDSRRLSDASSYMTSVEVVSDDIDERIIQLNGWCKKKNIPFNVYPDMKSFMSRVNVVNVDKVLDMKPQMHDNDDRFGALLNLLQFVQRHKSVTLTDEAKDIALGIASTKFDYSDLRRLLKSTSGSDEHIQNIYREMQRNDLRSYRELYDFIRLRLNWIFQ